MEMAPLALCASFPSIGAGCRPRTRDQSDGSASHGEAHSLAQHHADNVGSARAERESNPDLMRARGDHVGMTPSMPTHASTNAVRAKRTTISSENRLWESEADTVSSSRCAP